MTKETLFIVLWILLTPANIYSQEKGLYFPTGMKWKEVVADPNYEMDTTFNHVYEIGEDVILNEKTYKRIILDGEVIPLWIREEGEQVWLFTNDYKDEIKLYDFDWNQLPVSMEFLQKNEGGTELKTWAIKEYDCAYDWIYDWRTEGVTIQGIGRVTELNRNSCLLGYIYPEMVVPGLDYIKVLWIKRYGKEIFRSENPKEWTRELPTKVTYNIYEVKDNSQSTYDLSGRKVSKPKSGVYIKDKKKVVLR